MRLPSTAYTALRRCAQLLTVLLFCLLPWLEAGEAQQSAPVKGSLFALDLGGLPFADPAAALQVVLSGLTPSGRLLLGALLSLGLAVLLGRVFCSWICPYGLFSELAYALRHNRGNQGKAGSSPRPCLKRAAAFACKAVILALAVSVAAVWAYPLLNLLSMPGELSLWPLLVRQGASLFFLLSALALPVAALILEAFSGTRLWCRFVCPQSVTLGLAARCLPPKAPGLRIAWHAQHCTCKGEMPCKQACSLALAPRQAGGPPRQDCVMCGECLTACAMRGGALRWQIRPAAARRHAGTATALHPGKSDLASK